jgi:uncharacterized cupredoxin-like copper-binding protein
MSKMKIVWLVLLAFALAACGGGDTHDDGDAHSGDNAPLEFVIEAHDFGFTPDMIEVSVGQPVRLTFNNVGLLEHDWSVTHIAVSHVREHSAQSGGHGDHMHAAGPEPDLHVAAVAGEQGVLEFTPTEPGEYDIICTVTGHEEAGMVGRLIVRP